MVILVRYLYRMLSTLNIIQMYKLSNTERATGCVISFYHVFRQLNHNIFKDNLYIYARLKNYCILHTNPKTELPLTKREYYRYRLWAYRLTHPDYYSREKEIQNTKNRELKQRVFNHYGLSCNRCGFDDLRCLQLHHINGDGKTHREGLTGSFYRSIEKERYPDGLEVVCANCHAVEHCKYI